MAVLSCYRAAMLSSGLVDFNDMLELSRSLLHDHPHVLEQVQRTYTHLLVDEYQDSSPVQVGGTLQASIVCRPLCYLLTSGFSFKALLCAVFQGVHRCAAVGTRYVFPCPLLPCAGFPSHAPAARTRLCDCSRRRCAVHLRLQRCQCQGVSHLSK